MHKRSCTLLAAALVLVAAFAGIALAQSLGLGTGVDDLYPGKGAGVIPPAGCKLALDFSASCNLIETATVGIAR